MIGIISVFGSVSIALVIVIIVVFVISFINDIIHIVINIILVMFTVAVLGGGSGRDVSRNGYSSRSCCRRRRLPSRQPVAVAV